MSANRHVAIDGPSASGKTVVSRALASRLGILYLDTGAMYRAVAYLALRNALDLDNESGLADLLAHHSLRIVSDAHAPNGYRVLIDGRDVSESLTQPDVTAAVSTVAAAPKVRSALVTRQQAIAGAEPVVMAGRDIGTVVLPDATYKFFLTASLAERAKRRQAELAANGLKVTEAEVAAQLAERDRIDGSRAASPLRVPEGALVIDSSDIPVELVVARMLDAMQPR